MVVKINENYLKLKSSYLFVEVARREAEFTKANPDADVIKMGIGDVTKPLVPAVIDAFRKAVDEMADGETFMGYGPALTWTLQRSSSVTVQNVTQVTSRKSSESTTRLQ